jgi:cell division protein FtsQ
VLLAGVLGAAWLAYLLLLSAVLGVRSVDVVGTGVLSADEVRAAAGVAAGRPMLRLDVDAVADRVRGLPAVHAVQVERTWPSTVTIRITERVPLAFAPVPGGVRLVDATGLEFATVAAWPPGLPELRASSSEATAAAAGVLVALARPGHDGLRAELVAVHADSPFDVRLVLRGDRTVRWGSVEGSDRKAAVLAVLLSQRGQIYDVASPDLPTIR